MKKIIILCLLIMLIISVSSLAFNTRIRNSTNSSNVCPYGLTACGPKKDCVDTKTDPSNCGVGVEACGNWCFDSKKYPGVKTAECSNSVCIMKACKNGYTLVNGLCVKEVSLPFSSKYCVFV